MVQLFGNKEAVMALGLLGRAMSSVKAAAQKLASFVSELGSPVPKASRNEIVSWHQEGPFSNRSLNRIPNIDNSPRLAFQAMHRNTGRELLSFIDS